MLARCKEPRFSPARTRPDSTLLNRPICSSLRSTGDRGGFALGPSRAASRSSTAAVHRRLIAHLCHRAELKLSFKEHGGRYRGPRQYDFQSCQRRISTGARPVQEPSILQRSFYCPTSSANRALGLRQWRWFRAYSLRRGGRGCSASYDTPVRNPFKPICRNFGLFGHRPAIHRDELSFTSGGSAVFR